jgi:hypothetical protein
LKRWGQNPSKAVSVVLTEKQHKKISKRLTHSMPTGREYGKLRVATKLTWVYRGHPRWLLASWREILRGA